MSRDPDGHRVKLIPVDVGVGLPTPFGDVGGAEAGGVAVVKLLARAGQDRDRVVQALDQDLVAMPGEVVALVTERAAGNEPSRAGEDVLGGVVGGVAALVTEVHRTNEPLPRPHPATEQVALKRADPL